MPDANANSSKSVRHWALPDPVLEGLTSLGHSGVLWRGTRAVYVDPWGLGKSPAPADIVLITHPHFDHCSPDDVARVAREGTAVVGPSDALEKITVGRRIPLAPGGMWEIAGVRIAGVPAFNQKRPHHPKDKGWLGFVVEMDGQRLYHAGDTDVLSVMEGARPDIALLPVDTLYTMLAESAADAAAGLGAGFLAPIHCGSFTGRPAEASRFIAECRRRGMNADFLPKTFEAQDDPVPPVALKLK